MKQLIYLVALLFTVKGAMAGETGSNLGEATFAGGCFWCMEAPFEKLNGVVSVTSGFTGGKEINPTYKEVSSGTTGHREAIHIVFDKRIISYKKLLEVFWRQIDPTDPNGQFADRGPQYTTAIFYYSDEQRRLAAASKRHLEQSKHFKAPIVTPIIKAGPFYRAEAYHQDFYKKNPVRYHAYRKGSGREGFLKSTWKDETAGHVTEQFTKPPKAVLKKRLSAIQYSVTQENGTEPPFQNAFWKNKKEGIYVDLISGEPLFSSKDKFDSGTGWPSFTRPLIPGNVVEVADSSHGMVRVEVRSRAADSHLGHVFDDGPKPTGKRYCINSAALEFIPRSALASRGLEKFDRLFN